jgi:hypothetical protein
MNNYEEVRDRANALLKRLEAYESREEDEIPMAWLTGEVCHLRGAFICQAFVLWNAEAALERRTKERDRARASVYHLPGCPLAEFRDGPCSCGHDRAVADEPSEETP